MGSPRWVAQYRTPGWIPCWKRLPPGSYGEDAVIEGFRSQATSVCVGVRASMDRAVAENASLVLDGVSGPVTEEQGKFLAYALGRYLELTDRAAVDAICYAVRNDDDSFRTLMEQVVLSEPFLTK